MTSMLRYTVLRLLLFFGFVCALWLVHVRGLWLVILAAVLSMALSFVLLKGPRQAFSAQMAEHIEARLQRHEPAPDSPTDEDIEDADFPDGRPHTGSG